MAPQGRALQHEAATILKDWEQFGCPTATGKDWTTAQIQAAIDTIRLGHPTDRSTLMRRRVGFRLLLGPHQSPVRHFQRRRQKVHHNASIRGEGQIRQKHSAHRRRSRNLLHQHHRAIANGSGAGTLTLGQQGQHSSSAPSDCKREHTGN